MFINASIRRLRRAVPVYLGVLCMFVAGLLAGTPAAAYEAGGTHDRAGHYEGEIDGAKYRVEVPEGWNGTLVLYSHGFYPADYAPWPKEHALANNRLTTEWLLEHGYALAASEYKGRYGHRIEEALHDQMALLDWFDEHIGQPERTIASGSSMGGAIAILLAERNPERFDAVASFCGDLDAVGTWNTALDVTFAVRTLLTDNDEIELVRADDPDAANQALSQAVIDATKTDEGRAKLALIGALGNIPGWYSTYEPMPRDLGGRMSQQALWIRWAYVAGMGPKGRSDLEQRAGGNPSGNAGIDYGQLFAKADSKLKRMARRAYRDVGLDPRAALGELAQAPRVEPDDAAVRYLRRYGVVQGTTPAPVITVHGTHDGGASTSQERWYAAQVRRHGHPGMLRQVYVERGGRVRRPLPAGVRDR